MKVIKFIKKSFLTKETITSNTITMKSKLLYLGLFFFLKISAQIPITALDSEYKFTNGSLNDTFGTTQNLTSTGTAATIVEDRFNNISNAINLSGDYLKRSAIFSNDLSVSFWIKTNTINTNKLTIIDQTTRTSNTEDNTKTGWYTYLQNGKVGIAANFSWTYQFNTISYGGNSDYTNVISTASVSDNNWHHIVITFQKSSSYPSPGALRMTYSYKIYIDNVLDASGGDSYQTVSGAMGHAWNLLSTLTSVTIANDHLNNLTNRYTGIIDDIRFYNTTLNATNVSDLFNEANTLNTNSFSNWNDFAVYPNPASEEIKVNSMETIDNLSIVSLAGRKIKTTSASSVNISDLANGIYVLQVTTDSGKIGNKKFVKN